MDKLIEMILRNGAFMLLFSGIAITTSPGICQDIKVDHVISVVANIDKSIQEFEEKGFSVKPGTKHDNGLINAHIKFKNGTSFELMSLRGEPKDDMAREYQSLLREEQRGVYLALAGIQTNSLSVVLTELGIQHHNIPGKNWNYITFPRSSGLEHLFFIQYLAEFQDSQHVFNHRNESEQIGKIYIEGDKEVTKFLSDIGLRSLRKPDDTPWGPGVEYPTETGSIIVVPSQDQSKRPEILSVIFDRSNGSEVFQVDY